MGYYSQVTGEIHIYPLLSHKIMVELISKGYAEDASNKHMTNRDALVDYDVINTVTDEGNLTSYTGWAIVPSSEDSYKAYDLQKHVQEIVDCLGVQDYTYQGYLEIKGEEQGDLWRLMVKDGKVVEVKPQIVWPDEA